MGLICHFGFFGPCMGPKIGVAPRMPIWVWGLKTQPKSWPTGWTFWANHLLEIMFLKFGGLNPPFPLKAYFWHTTFSVIFHPILMFIFKLPVFFSGLIEWCWKLHSISFSLDLGFWTNFLLQGLTWAILHAWTQNHPQMSGHVLAVPFNS